jgi:hypothetical protein
MAVRSRRIGVCIRHSASRHWHVTLAAGLLLAAGILGVGPALALPLLQLPACYDFNDSSEGLFTYEYSGLPGYQCAGIPIAPGTLTDSDVLAFTFTVTEGSVPNQYGSGSRIGLTTSATYGDFLGVSLVYTSSICYRVALVANSTSGALFVAQPGTTYRAEITCAAGTASLALIDQASGLVVHTDAISYTPFYFDIFQCGLDYPGQAICGPTHFWWDETSSTISFCVDRDMGPYLRGWVDDVHTPGCVPVPEVPFVCHGFNLFDEGLFTYEYSVLPDYQCAGIPVAPGTMAEGDVLDFTFAVTACDVPNEWGTGSRMGLTTADTYGDFVGISLVYDDNTCLRIYLHANGVSGAAYLATAGLSYRANITYADGQATLKLVDLAADEVVFMDELPYSPAYFDIMQIGIDYPGQAHCGPTHFWWDEGLGHAQFCVDRDTGPYLEGWFDNLHTPGCDAVPPQPPVCYDFNESDDGLFTYEYPVLPGYVCGGIPIEPGLMTDGDVLDFTFAVTDCDVPNEWGTGSRMGLATAQEYDQFLGIGLVYDDNFCYRAAFSANGNNATPFPLTPGVTYRAHIGYSGGTATLTLIDAAAAQVVHVATLPYTPAPFDMMQLGLDYPGQAHCGPTHFWWNQPTGRAEFCVDRDTGPYLTGWVDDIHTPGCDAVPAQPPVCYDFTGFDQGLFAYEYDDLPGYQCGAFPVEPGVMSAGDVLDFVFAISDCDVPNEWGTGSRMGITTTQDYGHFLGVGLVYDNNTCYQVSFSANGVSGSLYQATPGTTYRAHIDYNGAIATLRLVDVNAEQVVWIQSLPYEPYAFDIMQVGLDYPGQDYCGPTHFWWSAAYERAEFCVDRNTGPHMTGWLDSVHTPRCSSVACYDFNVSDEGLFEYEYAELPSYSCAAIPVQSHAMENGDVLVFNFAVTEGAVPNEWGTGSRVGLTTTSNYSDFLGISLVYDDNICYRVFLVANGLSGGGYVASAGHSYSAVVHYRDGFATLHLTDMDSGQEVHTEQLQYEPTYFDIMQLGLDYPGQGQAHCGATHFGWDQAEGRARFCVDRDTGPYLEGWVDNIHVPGCWPPPSGVIDAQPATTSLSLDAAPNPLTSGTALRFSMPAKQSGDLRVFDLTGRLVRTLLDGEIGSGPQVINWDGRDDAGRTIRNGIYYARLRTGSKVASRQLILMR